MTDLYPDEEGVLVDGLSIAICQAATSITALSSVKLGTTATSGVISIVQGDYGLSIGLAMKAGVTSDMIPVLLYGIAKVLAGAVITGGDSILPGTTAGYFIPIPFTAGSLVTSPKVLNATGVLTIIGKALQNAAATGDEFLLLVAPL